MIPNLSTQLLFKAILYAMDKEDYESGKISKNTLASERCSSWLY